MKKLLFFILIFLTTYPLAEQSKAQEIKKIKLSALLHLTGDFAMEGHAFREGVELGIEEANKNLVKFGKKVEVELYDTRYVVKDIVSIAQKVIASGDSHGLIISTFFETKPIAKMIEKAKIPTIVLWDATPEIEDFGDYIFSIGPWAPDTGSKCVRFAQQVLGSKTAAIILQQNDWSLAVAKTFEEQFGKSGKITSVQTLNPDELDFKTFLSRIRTEKPDVVYAPIVYGLSTFVKQFKQMLPNVPLITSDLISEHLINQDPRSFEGVYGSAVAEPDNAKSKLLRMSYYNKFKKQPSLVLFNTWGYDSILIFAETILRGAKAKEEIKEQIYKIKDLEGSSGLINFNEKGSAPKYISMFQVVNKQLKMVSSPDPEL